MFGCTPVIFPTEAKEGQDYWSQATLTMEPYKNRCGMDIQLGISSLTFSSPSVSTVISSSLQNQMVA